MIAAISSPAMTRDVPIIGSVIGSAADEAKSLISVIDILICIYRLYAPIFAHALFFLMHWPHYA